MPGAHNVQNALAACAAAVALDVAPADIAAGLASFSGVTARLQRKRGLAGATIIDDSYNANPDLFAAAIDVLGRMTGEKILVLGDMGEIGANAIELHRESADTPRRPRSTACCLSVR